MGNEIENAIKKEEHSEMGGSGAHVWVECPGSIFLKRELVKNGTVVDTESSASIRGTLAHACAAKCLKVFLEAKKYVDAHKTECSIEEVTREIDDLEIRESVAAYVHDVWSRGLEGWVTGKTYGIEETIYLNKRLGIFGTVDFYAYYINDKAQHVLYVADYKSGVVPVPDPSENNQLFFYALGIYNKLKNVKNKIDVIRLAICQPDSYDDNTYMEAEIKPKKLQAFEKKVIKIAKSVYVDNKPVFKVGGHCSECKFSHVCSTYFGHSIKQMTCLQAPEQHDLVNIETVSEDKMLKIAMHKEALKSYIDNVYKAVIGRVLKDPTKFKDYKVVFSGGRRSWKKDRHEEIISFLNKQNIKPFKPETTLVPFGSVEKLLGKGSIDEYLEKSQGALTLVSSDDPRPAADMLDASAKEILELNV